jgi:hypothetical protein
MAIRIRKVKGRLLALCAAKTKPEKDDIYLDDNIHHALSEKFSIDFYSMGFVDSLMVDEESLKLIDQEKLL